MINIDKVFKTKRPLIGMVHLAPLLGIAEAPTLEQNLENALKDAKTLQDAGFDSIIIENNYDLPHDIFVKPNVTSSFTYIAKSIADEIKIPIGICVLWNDFYSALSIAKIINVSYVRVAVFVDDIMTNYGRVTGDSTAVINFRKQIFALKKIGKHFYFCNGRSQ